MRSQRLLFALTTIAVVCSGHGVEWERNWSGEERGKDLLQTQGFERMLIEAHTAFWAGTGDASGPSGGKPVEVSR